MPGSQISVLFPSSPSIRAFALVFCPTHTSRQAGETEHAINGGTGGESERRVNNYLVCVCCLIIISLFVPREKGRGKVYGAGITSFSLVL